VRRAEPGAVRRARPSPQSCRLAFGRCGAGAALLALHR
jgi:hypothetical protein